jgi:hypothetical protein
MTCAGQFIIGACFPEGEKKLFYTPVSIVGYGVAELVEALRYKPEGSIPDGVIGIFQ